MLFVTNLLIIISILLEVSTSLIIYLKNRKDLTNLMFAVLGIVMTVWSISLLIYSNHLFFDTTTAIKFVYSVGILCAITIVIFIRRFPILVNKEISSLYYLIIIFGIILLFINWNTNLIVEYGLWKNGKAITQVGKGYILYVLWGFLVCLQMILEIRIKLKYLIGIDRSKLTFMKYGLYVLFVWFSIPDFIFPLLFNNSDYFALSAVGTGIFTVIVYYSMVKNRLIDTKILLKNILFSFVSSLSAFILYNYISL